MVLFVDGLYISSGLNSGIVETYTCQFKHG